ncbi:MarC family protein [Bradyrhizobium sp. Pha-3]|uniref:MarC family protein n=1 Tax=Bradyrhizobium sp. Pha-3 TaxID=208375 RepID=UPI0035D4C9D9
MTEFITSRWLGDFLFAFGALFAIINPYGLAFIFHDRTIGLTDRERARIALRIAVYAFAVILMSLFVGGHVLRFFGITMPALRIGGGLVVAATGWSMLHAAPVAHDVHATSTAGFSAIRRMAFFPMTIPLTTGPGTIATAIAIGTNRPDDMDGLFYSSVVFLLVTVCVTATIYHAYRRSSAMARLFGEEGTSVVTKLSAFLLLCIGVQIVITGVVEVARSVTGISV